MTCDNLDYAVIYLYHFDQTQAIDTIGRVDYKYVMDAPIADAQLFVNVKLDNLKNAFLFQFTGDKFDIQNTTAKWNSSSPIIPSRKADNSITTEDTVADYNFYTERTTGANFDASEDFVQHLAKEIFGYIGSSDLFENKDELKIAFKEAILHLGYLVQTTETNSLSFYGETFLPAFSSMMMKSLTVEDTNNILKNKIVVLADENKGLHIKVSFDSHSIPNFVEMVYPGSEYVSGETIMFTHKEDDKSANIDVILNDPSLEWVNGNMKTASTFTGTVADGVYQIKDDNKASNEGAVFEIVIAGGELTHIFVSTRGENYIEEDIVLSIHETGTVNISTITEHLPYLNRGINTGGKAAMGVLTKMYAHAKCRFTNGIFENSDDNEYKKMPFIEGDTIQIVFDIMSNAEQKNVTNDAVYISRRVLISLVAKDMTENFGLPSLDASMFTKEIAMFQELSDEDKNIVNITGVIQFIKLEGGFYGIVGSNNENYLPMNIQKLCEENIGKTVTVKGYTKKDMVSLYMWGTLLYVSEVVSITTQEN